MKEGKREEASRVEASRLQTDETVTEKRWGTRSGKFTLSESGQAPKEIV